MRPAITDITNRIIERSKASRANYLLRMQKAKDAGPGRSAMSCGNFAHAIAASPIKDKLTLRNKETKNIGIVTAYNDLLSAHQPFAAYPDIIKDAARTVGATAQVAGGVPAMCDGVTQGQPGMELSLFSRDVIAMATAISLSHNVFDGALMLGVCDKIVPGLLIGALSFGHLPTIFVPAGPMTSGLPNQEKARIRQLHAEGKIGRAELLEAEEKSYHGIGTCTFYGTANSNQMLMEIMGLQLPGSSFVNPGQQLRGLLTSTAGTQAVELARSNTASLAQIVTEKAIVNGIVGLMATGGSTNLALHIVAIARAAGIIVNWSDFSEISKTVPLLARVYPNGYADINVFHAAGGMAFLIRELLGGGLLHPDTMTIMGGGLESYTKESFVEESQLVWKDGAIKSLNEEVLRPIDNPFAPNGGMRLLDGNIGRAVIKVSAVAPEHRIVEAPAIVFHDQDALPAAYKAGDLNKDFIAVIRFQGPKANGMPELHKLTPTLTALQSKGYKIGLVTDGRMSGASGTIPAAIHITPEAKDAGPIARIQEGDMIKLDARAGTLNVRVDEATLAGRSVVKHDHENTGIGRELFENMRRSAGAAEQGASIFWN